MKLNTWVSGGTCASGWFREECVRAKLEGAGRTTWGSLGGDIIGEPTIAS